ncbi:hypothetical protein BDZ45DRAFT_808002 [Acephala macrosclerotiorum]|nr:hypothetical protein BDZ45DRAFT_808002 [Acephala macrosclerotiorum]
MQYEVKRLRVHEQKQELIFATIYNFNLFFSLPLPPHQQPHQNLMPTIRNLPMEFLLERAKTTNRIHPPERAGETTIELWNLIYQSRSLPHQLHRNLMSIIVRPNLQIELLLEHTNTTNGTHPPEGVGESVTTVELWELFIRIKPKNPEPNIPNGIHENSTSTPWYTSERRSQNIYTKSMHAHHAKNVLDWKIIFKKEDRYAVEYSGAREL